MTEYRECFSSRRFSQLKESNCLINGENHQIHQPNSSMQKMLCGSSVRNSNSNSSWTAQSTDSGESDELSCVYRSGNHHSSFDHDRGQSVENFQRLLGKIAVLFDSPDLSDIQIVVGHRIYHAHKLILCCASDVFRVMLMNPLWSESNRERIVLKEETDCVHVFDQFLKYLYTGQIQLTHGSVLAVLMLADKYNVDDLQELCREFMCSHLVSTVEHNHALSWLQYSYIGGHRHLASECYQFVLWNFHKVLCTKDFLATEKDVLVSFLRQSELIVPDEYTLFKGISKWIMYHHNRNSNGNSAFHSMALEVLTCIRFPLIPPAQLSLVSSDPLSDTFPEFFAERIFAANTFHSSNEHARRWMASASRDATNFVPRNYTNEIWSTTLSIDHFSSLAPHEVRPLFFSTPVSAAQSDESLSWEWNVDLYPKGINFQRCIMIGLFRNLEISGAFYDTIRLVLATKTAEKRDVEVAILVTGVQDDVEYIRHVVQRRCMFDEEIRLCHINDIVPYNELNSENSPFLCGPDANTFKITIVIKPILSS